MTTTTGAKTRHKKVNLPRCFKIHRSSSVKIRQFHVVLQSCSDGKEMYKKASLRSKRFQSCYCAKVTFPSPSPVIHFFSALVPAFQTNLARKRLLRSVIHVQSCCLPIEPIAFLPFLLPSPLLLLNLPRESVECSGEYVGTTFSSRATSSYAHVSRIRAERAQHCFEPS